MTDLIPLLGYNRVSGSDQVKYGHSLEIQPLRHAKWCEAMGYQLVDVVSDPAVSAGSKRFEDRKGGAEIMRRLSEGEAAGMLVTRFDRAFRIAVDGLQQLDWFLDRDLIVTSIEMPLDLRTTCGWKVFAQQVVDAEFERRMTVDRARETTESLIEQGKVFGPVAFGCVANDGLIYRDPASWPVREMIVQLRQEGGEDGEGLSLRELVDHLFKNNVPAPGGFARDGKTRGGKRWHVSTLRNLLETHHRYQYRPFLSGALEVTDSKDNLQLVK